MKKFALLSYGFKTPTPEIMEAWGKWFKSIGDKIVEQGGFNAGLEISDAGTKELPMGMESITGYLVINAESIEEAKEIAGSNPYIASIRVYEIRTM